MISPRQMKELYEKGENISSLLRDVQGGGRNTENNIEISYDLQAGSYINALKDEKMAAHKKEYAAEIAQIILSLCEPSSVLEAGVGEATTLARVIESFSASHSVNFYGFDLCWSRIAYAKKFLAENRQENVTLCTGSLFEIPFATNSIDVVYTSHSIEPNGGSEIPILRELYRVASKYLVLLEPGYEFASEEGKKRMVKHGYCYGLQEAIASLGWTILKHDVFPYVANPLNPTAITIIKKKDDKQKDNRPDQVLACPKFKNPLLKRGDVFFSEEGLCVYPVLAGIPCLRSENAIIASHYPEVAASL
jgi:uncharacterized protein YbaR (Trm112 family)